MVASDAEHIGCIAEPLLLTIRSNAMPVSPITNTIHTGPGNDNVHISKAPGLLGLLGLYEVNINGHKQYMTAQQLEHTKFDLGSGDDTLVVDSNVHVGIHADGGSGDDVMIGGSGDDDLHGGSGDDYIAGRDGNDVIDGGSGDDVEYGGRGDDVLLGGSGDDLQVGGDGNDIIVGGSGDDSQFGGRGHEFF